MRRASWTALCKQALLTNRSGMLTASWTALRMQSARRRAYQRHPGEWMQQRPAPQRLQRRGIGAEAMMFRPHHPQSGTQQHPAMVAPRLRQVWQPLLRDPRGSWRWQMSRTSATRRLAFFRWRDIISYWSAHRLLPLGVRASARTSAHVCVRACERTREPLVHTNTYVSVWT